MQLCKKYITIYIGPFHTQPTEFRHFEKFYNFFKTQSIFQLIIPFNIVQQKKKIWCITIWGFIKY